MLATTFVIRLRNIALLASLLVALPVHAATYTCVTNAMRGNKWICKDDPSLCTFVFIVNEREKTMVRRVDERNPKVAVVVD